MNKQTKTMTREAEQKEIKLKGRPEFTFWYYVNHNVKGLASGDDCQIIDKALNTSLKQIKDETNANWKQAVQKLKEEFKTPYGVIEANVEDVYELIDKIFGGLAE